MDAIDEASMRIDEPRIKPLPVADFLVPIARMIARMVRLGDKSRCAVQPTDWIKLEIENIG